MDYAELIVSKELRESMKPGHIMKMVFSENDIVNKTIYIRAVVDDNWIVYKYWAERKKCWVYIIEYIYLLELLYRNGGLLIIE